MIPFFWYDLIIIPGIIQGIFLAFFLLRNNRTNQNATKILIWILFMAAFMLIGRMFWLRYPSEWPIQMSLIADTTIFIFGPLFYFYIRRLLFQSTTNQKIPSFHFIPAAFHLVKSLYYLTMPQNEFLKFLWETRYIDYRLTEGVAILLNFIYWILGYRMIRAYIRNEKDQVSNLQGAVAFLKYFHLTVILLLVFWSVSFISSTWLSQPLRVINYDSVWIVISLFTYVVGYYSLKQPQLFQMSKEQVRKTSARMSQKEVDLLTNKLTQLMASEKPYLNRDLTLSDLAAKLETSQNNISWLLNEVHGKNFYDYINQFRINEFKLKVSNKEHIKKTIYALALEVGFNSKSTFNKYFQAEVNDAPSSYIKKVMAQEA